MKNNCTMHQGINRLFCGIVSCVLFTSNKTSYYTIENGLLQFNWYGVPCDVINPKRELKQYADQPVICIAINETT